MRKRIGPVCLRMRNQHCNALESSFQTQKTFKLSGELYPMPFALNIDLKSAENLMTKKDMIYIRPRRESYLTR